MMLPLFLMTLAAATSSGSLSAPISALSTPSSSTVSADALKNAGVVDLPPAPPALTLTQVPGANTFMVSVELKTVSLPVDKLSTVQGALQTADLANLRSLFAAAKTARDAAVAAVSDADMANKDAQREKDKANQYQSEYDHVKKNTHVNHNELLENLKTAKDNASRLDAVAKGNATNVKSAVSAYNAALAAYNTAFKAASPSIDTFKHAAGL